MLLVSPITTRYMLFIADLLPKTKTAYGSIDTTQSNRSRYTFASVLCNTDSDGKKTACYSSKVSFFVLFVRFFVQLGSEVRSLPVISEGAAVF